MDLPVNGFKRALAARKPQIGFWCTLPGGYAAEVLAGAGFDWLLFDTEHSPADPITVLPQLQAAAPYRRRLRRAGGLERHRADQALPRRRGADAARALRAVRRGGAGGGGGDALSRRGGCAGSARSSRATRFGRVADYATRADEELCLLVQVETAEALAEIEAIAAVDGVDGIFVGPTTWRRASAIRATRPSGGGGGGRGRDRADRAGRQAGRAS